MPRPKKTPHRRREALGYGHVWHLCVGEDHARPPSGWDNEADRQAMEKAWPVLRAKVLDLCKRRRQARSGNGRIRPYGWWEFESAEARDERVSELDQLRRMGLLDKTETA